MTVNVKDEERANRQSVADLYNNVIQPNQNQGTPKIYKPNNPE